MDIFGSLEALQVLGLFQGRSATAHKQGPRDRLVAPNRTSSLKNRKIFTRIILTREGRDSYHRVFLPRAGKSFRSAADRCQGSEAGAVRQGQIL